MIHFTNTRNQQRNVDASLNGLIQADAALMREIEECGRNGGRGRAMFSKAWVSLREVLADRKVVRAWREAIEWLCFPCPVDVINKVAAKLGLAYWNGMYVLDQPRVWRAVRDAGRGWEATKAIAEELGLSERLSKKQSFRRVLARAGRDSRRAVSERESLLSEGVEPNPGPPKKAWAPAKKATNSMDAAIAAVREEGERAAAANAAIADVKDMHEEEAGKVEVAKPKRIIQSMQPWVASRSYAWAEDENGEPIAYDDLHPNHRRFLEQSDVDFTITYRCVRPKGSIKWGYAIANVLSSIVPAAVGCLAHELTTGTDGIAQLAWFGTGMICVVKPAINIISAIMRGTPLRRVEALRAGWVSRQTGNVPDRRDAKVVAQEGQVAMRLCRAIMVPIQAEVVDHDVREIRQFDQQEGLITGVAAKARIQVTTIEVPRDVDIAKECEMIHEAKKTREAWWHLRQVVDSPAKRSIRSICSDTRRYEFVEDEPERKAGIFGVKVNAVVVYDETIDMRRLGASIIHTANLCTERQAWATALTRSKYSLQRDEAEWTSTQAYHIAQHAIHQSRAAAALVPGFVRVL